jgi:hypothetical protein
MSNPSWRQLAQIPESTLKASILHALGITPPPEGVSRVFSEPATYLEFTHDNAWVVSLRGPGDPPATFGFPSDQGSQALRAINSPPGTPSGIALRAFMRRWGWVPKGERQPEPNDNTKTII